MITWKDYSYHIEYHACGWINSYAKALSVGNVVEVELSKGEFGSIIETKW